MSKDTYDKKKTSRITDKKTKPAITVDVKKYEHYLENSGLTQEQKEEYLQTLWNIIVEFVSLGWGVHPLQQLENGCGESSKNISLDTCLLYTSPSPRDS